MLAHQIGNVENLAALGRLQLDDVWIAFHDLVSRRQRINHKNVMCLGISLDNSKRLAEERTDNQIKVLASNAPQGPFRCTHIIGDIQHGQIEFEALLVGHVLHSHHKTFVERQERERTRLLQPRQVVLRDFKTNHIVEIKRYHQGDLVMFRGIGRVSVTFGSFQWLVEHDGRLLCADRFFYRFWLFLLLHNRLVHHLMFGFDTVNRYQNHLIDKHMRTHRNIHGAELGLVDLPAFQQRRGALVELSLMHNVVILVDNIRHRNGHAFVDCVGQAGIKSLEISDINTKLLGDVV